MSEDRMRAMFRRADAVLGHNPPSLDATVRQAKREQVVRRAVYASAAALVIAVLGVAAYSALRLERSALTPVAPPGLPTPPATPRPTDPCGGPYAEEPGSLADGDAKRFIDAFMQRRIAQSGAEFCMSDGARAEYEGRAHHEYDPEAFGGAGPLCLYRCGPFRVVDYRLDVDPQQADANSFYADVIVVLNDGTETIRITEPITFGPGLQWASNTPLDLVIRGVGNAE